MPNESMLSHLRHVHALLDDAEKACERRDGKACSAAMDAAFVYAVEHLPTSVVTWLWRADR